MLLRASSIQESQDPQTIDDFLQVTVCVEIAQRTGHVQTSAIAIFVVDSEIGVAIKFDPATPRYLRLKEISRAKVQQQRFSFKPVRNTALPRLGRSMQGATRSRSSQRAGLWSLVS